MENKIYSWTTKEFEHYEKGAGWYITLSILGFMVIAYQLYLQDYFGAVTILIILFAIYFFSRQLPREVEVTITDKGVSIDKAYYPYTSIKRFWIVDHAKAKHLTLETTAYLNRFLILLLADQDSEQISEILKQFLPETEPNKETVAQRLARRLRF